MSGTDTEDPGQETTLAAEYVLGTLEQPEAENARRRIDADPQFAAEVGVWEAHLAPLLALIPSVAPPASVWTRIEDSTGGAGTRGNAQAIAGRPANDNGLLWWRATAFAGLAVAAALAAYIVLTPPAQPTLAVLTPYGTPTPVLLAVAGPHGSILVRSTATIKIASDRDLELWALPMGATKPASLGVIPQEGKVVPPGVATGTLLLVSLEPKGGSPTGQPTGPVLYAGKLSRFE
jgi:anti-sigma-K factor RskA